MIAVHTFPSGPFATNCYLVVCPETKQTAIIDPAPESADDVIDFISKQALVPNKILLTHSHWDHIGDVSKLQKKYKIPVLIHADDAGNLEHPGSDGLPCWIDITGVTPTAFLKEGDRISVGTLNFEVIHTPGHTPGGVCFYCKEHGILLSGDTLFKGSIGNLSFPTARPNLMWPSLQKLAKLPAETRVYPGHGSPTTIGAEAWLEHAEDYFG